MAQYFGLKGARVAKTYAHFHINISESNPPPPGVNDGQSIINVYLPSSLKIISSSV